MHVAECLHKGDVLILDARIQQGTPQEPSEAVKRFVLAPLASVGIGPEDGELKFEENQRRSS